MMTTNLFVIANVKQLRTGGSFRILLHFFPRTSWGCWRPKFSNFYQFQQLGWVWHDLGGLSDFREGGFEPPPPSLCQSPSPYSGCAGGLVEPRLDLLLKLFMDSRPKKYTAQSGTSSEHSWFYQPTCYTLKMGTKLVTETSWKLHILTRLYAREYLMEVQNISPLNSKLNPISICCHY